MKKTLALLLSLGLTALFVKPAFSLESEGLAGVGAIIGDNFGITLDLGGASFLDFGNLAPGQGETGAVGFGSSYRTNRNLPWKVKLIVGGIEHYDTGAFLPLDLMQYKMIASPNAVGTATPGWDTWTAVPYGASWADIYTSAESEKITEYVAFGMQFKFTSIPATQRQGGYYGTIHVMMYDGF